MINKEILVLATNISQLLFLKYNIKIIIIFQYFCVLRGFQCYSLENKRITSYSQ